VLPLHVDEKKSRQTANLKLLTEATAALGNEYSNKIKNILFRIDNNNTSLQIHLRSAYSVYAGDPCNQLEYYKTRTISLSDNELTLKIVDTLITELRQLVTEQAKTKVPAPDSFMYAINQLLHRIAALIDFPPPPSGLAGTMAKTTVNVHEWMKETDAAV
jgi:hypothetical protein